MRRHSFNDLYSQFYNRSFSFVNSYVNNTLIAEDIVAESLTTLWLLIKEQEVENVQSFLFTTLKNRALDELRHQVVRQKVEKNYYDEFHREIQLRITSLETAEFDNILVEEIELIVNTTLKSLPLETQQVYFLSRDKLLTNKQIAEKNNISIKGVEYHITKALKALKIALKEYL